MTKIALEFQHLASLAVRSEYSHSDVFDKYRSLRLATAAIKRGDIFADKMTTAGHVFSFNPDHRGDITEEDDLDETALENLSLEESGNFDVRTEQDHPGVADLIFQNSSPSSAHTRGILAWIKKVHLESRGFELGTFKASFLAVTMKEQSRKWPSLALGYISDMVALLHTFITGLLKQVTPDETTRAGIESLLIDELRKGYQAAISHTEFLLKVELESNPATHNH